VQGKWLALGLLYQFGKQPIQQGMACRRARASASSAKLELSVIWFMA
jgi:hypothetical protein